jgi:hypothetical protein
MWFGQGEEAATHLMLRGLSWKNRTHKRDRVRDSTLKTALLPITCGNNHAKEKIHSESSFVKENGCFKNREKYQVSTIGDISVHFHQQ